MTSDDPNGTFTEPRLALLETNSSSFILNSTEGKGAARWRANERASPAQSSCGIIAFVTSCPNWV